MDLSEELNGTDDDTWDINADEARRAQKRNAMLDAEFQSAREALGAILDDRPTAADLEDFRKSLERHKAFMERFEPYLRKVRQRAHRGTPA